MDGRFFLDLTLFRTSHNIIFIYELVTHDVHVIQLLSDMCINFAIDLHNINKPHTYTWRYDSYKPFHDFKYNLVVLVILCNQQYKLHKKRHMPMFFNCYNVSWRAQKNIMTVSRLCKTVSQNTFYVRCLKMSRRTHLSYRIEKFMYV